MTYKQNFKLTFSEHDSEGEYLEEVLASKTEKRQLLKSWVEVITQEKRKII